MSTRKGSMVMVEELLREAKAVMVESQLKSRNTRVEGVEVSRDIGWSTKTNSVYFRMLFEDDKMMSS